MNDLLENGIAIYSRHKDGIIAGLLVLGVILKLFGDKIKAVARMAGYALGKAFWNIVWPPSKPLSEQAQRIVQRASNAVLMPGTKVLCDGDTEFHPDGKVMVASAFAFAPNGKLQVEPAIEVPLTKAEKAAVKEAYVLMYPLRKKEADAHARMTAAGEFARKGGSSSSSAKAINC